MWFKVAGDDHDPGAGEPIGNVAGEWRSDGIAPQEQRTNSRQTEIRDRKIAPEQWKDGRNRCSIAIVQGAREKQQRFVRALTHGMIAALNIYGATQQTNDTVKNALYFLGGVNTLAAISFAF